MELFVNSFLKLFFLFAPFFVLTVFLSLTRDMGDAVRKRIAVKCAVAVFLTGLVLMLGGQYLFQLLGITLDAFRVGAGALLFLSGVALVNGPDVDRQQKKPDEDPEQIAVVPLAIPAAVGPATTGALLVMAAEGRSWGSKGCFALALLAAAVSLGVILYAASFLERKLGQRRLAVLRRLTGLILCSMAAQMIMAGIAAMLHPAAVQP